MIMIYPANWPTKFPPVYLVCGDKAFFLADDLTRHNFARVGVPQVALTGDDITWVLGKLDPNVEHPLSSV